MSLTAYFRVNQEKQKVTVILGAQSEDLNEYLTNYINKYKLIKSGSYVDNLQNLLENFISQNYDILIKTCSHNKEIDEFIEKFRSSKDFNDQSLKVTIKRYTLNGTQEIPRTDEFGLDRTISRAADSIGSWAKKNESMELNSQSSSLSYSR